MTTVVSESLLTALYDQIGHEIKNSHIYKYIQCYLSNKGLDNLAKKFEGQYKEEQEHMNMIAGLLTDLGEPVIIPPIEGIAFPFDDSIFKIAELYLERETVTTENLEAIKDLAIDESNGIVEEFVRKMISAQQVEMEEAITFNDKAKLSGGDWRFILLWDSSEG